MRTIPHARASQLPRLAFAALAVLALVVLVPAGPSYSGEGQNPDDDTTNSTIDDLNLGEYWFGADVSGEDLVGKVVLFEIWGS